MHGQKTGVDPRMGDHYPRVWKPVIAAVNGWAAGAGLYMVLASTDIRIASREHARFKFALTTQGWLGHGPGATLLLKQLRYIDAMKMLLTDDPVDAEEALRIGLINEVVPHAELMARAEKIARHIVTMPPVAVRMMKEFVVRFGDLPTDQAWHVQNLINNLLIQVTTDGEEGRRAFNEKRPPTSPAPCAAAARPGPNPPRKTPSASTTRIEAASFRRDHSATHVGSARPPRSKRHETDRVLHVCRIVVVAYAAPGTECAPLLHLDGRGRSQSAPRRGPRGSGALWRRGLRR